MIGRNGKTVTRVGVLAAVVTIVGSRSAHAAEFWDTWGDGEAEVSSYRLSQPRYGELRSGQAVLIFVTEPFVRSTRVKADPGHPPADVFQVLKLNQLRTFQTGVYTYRVMTSTFSHVDREGPRAAGTPTKVTFSSQEWCGQVFHQLLFDADAVRDISFSYFDGEADTERKLGYPEGALVGDSLLVAARGLFGEWVEPGGRRTMPYLPTLMEVRLLHKALAWSTATVSRGAAPVGVETPAGEIVADVYTVESPGRPTLTVWVEAEPPRRIVGWRGSDGEEALLQGTTRMKYWQLNHPGDEQQLRRIGL